VIVQVEIVIFAPFVYFRYLGLKLFKMAASIRGLLRLPVKNTICRSFSASRVVLDGPNVDTPTHTSQVDVYLMSV